MRIGLEAVGETLRLFDADFESAFVVGCLGHFGAQPAWDFDAWDLVVHEFGVSGIAKRKHSDQHRQTEAFTLIDGLVRGFLFEDRLRVDEVRAGVGLALETVHFLAPILGQRIEGDGDRERAFDADAVACHVDAVVEAVEDAHEADGVHVIHARGAGVVADVGGVTRDCEDVANSQGMSPEEVGLDGEQISVAAGEVHHDFDANLVLDERADAERVHPQPGTCAV